MTEEQKSKWRSRTWRITVYWLALVPVAIVAQVMLRDLVEIPLGQIVGFAGAVSTAYQAKRGIQELKKKGPNG
jgi:hypothetical protein